MSKHLFCIVYLYNRVPIIIIVFFFYSSRMSYGWLTESSILPKKSKEIVVSDAGTIALQAAILDLKGKHARKPDKKP